MTGNGGSSSTGGTTGTGGSSSTGGIDRDGWSADDGTGARFGGRLDRDGWFVGHGRFDRDGRFAHRRVDGHGRHLLHRRYDRHGRDLLHRRHTGTGGNPGTAAPSSTRAACRSRSRAPPPAPRRPYLNLGDMRLINNRWGSDALGCSASHQNVFVNSDKTIGWTFNRGNCNERPRQSRTSPRWSSASRRSERPARC